MTGNENGQSMVLVDTIIKGSYVNEYQQSSWKDCT